MLLMLMLVVGLELKLNVFHKKGTLTPNTSNIIKRRHQTSDDDKEIMDCINLVVNSSRLGLIHESINVNNITDYTRPWFAWANSLFSQTILKIAEERPHLIFNDSTPYTVSK